MGFYDTLNEILKTLGDDDEEEIVNLPYNTLDSPSSEPVPLGNSAPPVAPPQGLMAGLGQTPHFDHPLMYGGGDGSGGDGTSVTVQGVGDPTVVPTTPQTGDMTVTSPPGQPFSQADRDLLARAILSDGARDWKTSGLFEAIGSTAINRIGDPSYKGYQSLQSVLTAPGQFQGVNDVSPASLWQQSADPSNLTGNNAKAYARAQDVANKLLSGQIGDNTGGATSFYSSPDGEPPNHYFATGMNSSMGKNGQFIPPSLERSREDIRPFTFVRVVPR